MLSLETLIPQTRPNVLIVGAGPSGLLAYDKIKKMDVNLTLTEWREEASIDRRFQVLFFDDKTLSELPEAVKEYLFNKDSPKSLIGSPSNVIPFHHTAVRIQDLVRGYLNHLNIPIQRGLKLIDVDGSPGRGYCAMFENEKGEFIFKDYDLMILACGYQGIRTLPEQLKEKIKIEEEFSSEHPSILAKLIIPPTESSLVAYYPVHNNSGVVSMVLRRPDEQMYLFSSIPKDREPEIRTDPKSFVEELKTLYSPLLNDSQIEELSLIQAKTGRIRSFYCAPYRTIIFGDAAGVGLFWRGLGYNMCVKTVPALQDTVNDLIKKRNLFKSFENYQTRCERIMNRWDFFSIPSAKKWPRHTDTLGNTIMMQVGYRIWSSLPEKLSISMRSSAQAQHLIYRIRNNLDDLFSSKSKSDDTDVDKPLLESRIEI